MSRTHRGGGLVVPPPSTDLFCADICDRFYLCGLAAEVILNLVARPNLAGDLAKIGTDSAKSWRFRLDFGQFRPDSGQIRPPSWAKLDTIQPKLRDFALI